MNVRRLVAFLLSATIIMQITPVRALDWQNQTNVTEDNNGNQIATPDWYEEGSLVQTQSNQTLGTENREIKWLHTYTYNYFGTIPGFWTRYLDPKYEKMPSTILAKSIAWSHETVYYAYEYVDIAGKSLDSIQELISNGYIYNGELSISKGTYYLNNVNKVYSCYLDNGNWYRVTSGFFMCTGNVPGELEYQQLKDTIDADCPGYVPYGKGYTDNGKGHYQWCSNIEKITCTCQLHEQTFTGKTVTTKSTDLSSTTNLDHSTCKLHPTSGAPVTTNYSVVSGQATISGSTLNLTATADGVYPVVVRCASTAYGITKYTDATITFDIDTAPPVITATAAPIEWQANDYNLAVSATDQSGITTLTYTDNDGAAQPVVGGYIPVTTSGIHNIQITATDNKGLSSSVTRTIKIDKEKPVVDNVTFQKLSALEQVINALTGGDFNDTVKVTIIASDAHSGVKMLSYQLDGQSSYTDLSSGNSFNISPDYDGYVKIIATDYAENPSNVYTTGKLIVEQMPPKLELAYDDIWQKDKAVIGVTAVDEGVVISGLDTVTYTTDETDPQSGIVSDGNITLINDGQYQVTITAKDKAGNSTVKQQHIRIDKAVPEIAVTGYESGTWIDHDAVFSLSNSTSNISGTTYQYAISQDGTSWTAWANTPANGAVTQSTRIKFRAVSGAGLVSTESPVYDVKIDREKPIIESVTFQKISALEQIINALTGGNFNDTVKVTIIATDSNSGVKKLSYQLDGQSRYTDLSSGNSFNISPDYDGYVKIIVADNAENPSDVYTTGKLIVEQMPPKLELAYDDIWQKEKAVIGVTAVDEGAVISGLDTVTYTTDETDPQSGIVSDGKITLINNGEYQVTVTAKDKAGNSTVKQQHIRIDKAVPEIAVTGYESSTWIAHDAVFSLSNLSANISGTTYQYATSTDGTNWASWTDTQTSQTVTESKKIKFRVVSGAGLVSTESPVYDVEIDREKPTTVNLNIALKNTAITNRALAGYYPDDVIVSFASADAGSGLKEIQYQLSDTATASADKWLTVPEGNKIEIADAYKGFVISRAIDNAGNVGDITSAPITVDKQRPELNIVSPANGAADIGIATEIVLQSNEPVQKGDGYLTIYASDTGKKYTDIHVSNNRVKISADGKTVTVKMLDVLQSGKTYYIVADKDFVRDLSGNANEPVGGKETSSFTTKQNDNTVSIMGYKVNVYEDSGRSSLLESVNAIADKSTQNKFNVIAKDVKKDGMFLDIYPTYSAKVSNLTVDTDNSTVKTSVVEDHLSVDIPTNVSSVNLNISVNGSSDVFSLTIYNANFAAEVYTKDVSASVDAGQIKGAVDVSDELDTADVTQVKVELSIVKTDASESELEKAQYLVKADGAQLGTSMQIEMKKYVEVNNQPDNNPEVITNTQNPIAIELTIPDEFKNAATFEIIRIHNGVAETLKATRVGDKIVFETDRFSTYFISYKNASGGSHKNTTITKGQLGRLLYDGTDIDATVPYCMSNGIRIIAPISMVLSDYVYFIAPVEGDYKLMRNDKPFDDIAGTWSESNIKNVTARELFNGVGDKIFAPELSMTRAMFATVMARLDNADLSAYKDLSVFSDVPADTWYAASVAWAADNKILQGVGDNRFAPYKEISREEIAAILSRYADVKDYALSQDAKQAEFEDKNDVSAWAIDGVDTIQKAGIIEGYQDKTFKPQATAERSEAAAMFKRFIAAILKNKI